MDVDAILEKYYVGCKYKATTTWYLKKNRNAPRPSEHPLVKTKRSQCSTHHQAWYYRNNGKTYDFSSKYRFTPRAHRALHTILFSTCFTLRVSFLTEDESYISSGDYV